MSEDSHLRPKPPRVRLNSDDDAPLVVRSSRIKPPRFSKFLDMHAKEGKEGHTASAESASEDDRDQPNLSYVVSDTSIDIDEDMRNIYRESLGSQGALLGFGTPIHKRRSKAKDEGRGSIFLGILNRQERKASRKIKTARSTAHIGTCPVTVVSPPKQLSKRSPSRSAHNAFHPFFRNFVRTHGFTPKAIVRKEPLPISKPSCQPLFWRFFITHGFSSETVV